MKQALLVIDVQNEYFSGKLPVTYPAGSLDNILKAMDAFRSKGVEVVVVQHTAPSENSITFRRGTFEWALHEEIDKRRYDVLIEKNLPGSFTNTNLEKWLRGRHVDTLVIAGYMTQMCCDTTARQAVHLGFSVIFLSDATGTLSVSNSAGSVTDEQLHKAILVTQASRFSKVMTTQDWLNTL
ncbi:MAG: cysteine hydrolase [Bacteroidetes bacterium]|nr:cysteine hydrolase [Bacteroidota bacterium]MCL5737046.1 cysteine hydrolase [Bacteroidota bacterium]